MKLSIPIEQTIRKRSSVRTYNDKPLSEKDLQKLKAITESLSNPFGAKVNFHFLEKSTESSGEKLGTYGVIKGAHFFVGASVAKTEFGLEAVGYEFESLILQATHMGLGTVWLAATFSRDQFSSAMGIKEEDLFPAISPVGYPMEKKRMKEALMRKLMKSDQRKPWEMLFFKDDFSTPLTKAEAGNYAQPLELLRLAPSATNAQPWRVLKKGGVFHFYKAYAANAKPDDRAIKRVDLGIAINHFHQAAMDKGLNGNFEKLNMQEVQVPQNMEYIISWVSL